MKTDTGVSLPIFIAVVMGEILHYCAADSQTGETNFDYNNYQNYYNQYEPIEPPPIDGPVDYEPYRPSINCFTCTLMVNEGHTQGQENCKDPFDRLDIPAVDCKGPCGKFYHQHGENDFMITRSCLPNCKEHRDDKSYTQCCNEPYCNRAGSSHSYHLGLWITSVLLTVYHLAQYRR